METPQSEKPSLGYSDDRRFRSLERPPRRSAESVKPGPESTTLLPFLEGWPSRFTYPCTLWQQRRKRRTSEGAAKNKKDCTQVLWIERGKRSPPRNMLPSLDEMGASICPGAR